MNDYDVVYVDEDDERNAMWRPGAPRPQRRPGGTSVVVPPSRRPTVVHGGFAAAAAGAYQGRPWGYAAPRPVTGPRFAGLSTAELVELGSKVLAAIQPLPSPPVAHGHATIDAENMVTYQSALATHAKRDSQLRTLGELLGKVLR